MGHPKAAANREDGEDSHGHKRNMTRHWYEHVLITADNNQSHTTDHTNDLY